ncbi:uncharacterized protein [Choristoneura fumiferana]|uniref:uncharacterized protein n=1 Tax=Choristoneura fumiferana TaxID=7141 RepID=UPI003D156BC5
MQCFICVTYMIFICSAYPHRQGAHNERSLFHDVIESLKIRAQLPEDTNQNEDNNLGQIYERYGYEDELHLPRDTEFLPRRNDRIALPPLKYRSPKMLVTNGTEPSAKSNNSSAPKEEIVVFISTTDVSQPSTEKSKKKTTKQPIKKKPNMDNENSSNKTLRIPVVNTMADQSHIGNKEIQMVVNPNIVINFRSSENNKDLKLDEGNNTSDILLPIIPQTIFNIHQEIKLDKYLLDTGVTQEDNKDKKRVKQSIKVLSRDVKPKVEEELTICETSTWDPEINNRSGRKYKNVLEILLSL